MGNRWIHSIRYREVELTSTNSLKELTNIKAENHFLRVRNEDHGPKHFIHALCMDIADIFICEANIQQLDLELTSKSSHYADNLTTFRIAHASKCGGKLL